MKTRIFYRIFFLVFVMIGIISLAGPAFAAPGDSCWWGWGTIDCNGRCRSNSWINRRLGNGTCNNVLNCSAFNYDDGDCVVSVDCYPDADGDNYGEEGSSPTTYPESTCPSGTAENNTDCDDTNAAVNPGASEVCDGLDNDCDGSIDEGLSRRWYYQDADNDGYGNRNVKVRDCTQPAGYVRDRRDCDDTNAAIHPGASEICDGLDNDCDGSIDEYLVHTYYEDADGDGYGAGAGTSTCNPDPGWIRRGGDCDDSNAAIHPHAREVCDGLDNDCNGSIDEGLSKRWYYQDADNDGYGNRNVKVRDCTQPAGYVRDRRDCDDTNAAIHPHAREICDGLDNDCDGRIDEGLYKRWYYPDADNDGYGSTSGGVYDCARPSGYVTSHTDCDDTNPDINPGASEVCNGVDDNCDGNIDEGMLTTYYADSDGDGYGDPANSTDACSAPAGYVTDNHDCDDTNAAVNPGASEVCNGVDDNCDGNIDEGVLTTYYADSDGDGYGDPANSTDACSAPAGYVTDNHDCDDTNAAVNPGASEICDGLDNNCDGNIDEGLATTPYYSDADGDGFGDPNNHMDACAAPPNYVADNTDCDDNNADINPAAVDICDNGIDENCNGADRPCGAVGSVCANLADIPLETQVQSAPPIVMFLIDDSGSMNWDVLCPENDGLFYGSSSYTNRQRYWKSQWAGYNGIYYDPELDYSPWPDSASNTYTDADPDYPKDKPDKTWGKTLNNEFLGYDGVSIRWSHYYVWSSTESAPYLVNITGSGGNYAIDYYKVGCEGGNCTVNHVRINNLTHDTTPPEDVVTPRTAAEERQNFANWYQYYRKRQLTALSSLSNVVSAVHGMKIGIHTINHSVNMVAPRDVDTKRGDILDDLYNVAASGGTPLRNGLKAVGNYFDNDSGGPFSSSDNGGQCQQAFCIAMTDGYYNGSSPGVGNTDGDNNTDFDGGVFGDAYSNTLADVAMKYYENDLNTGLSNNVPHNASDPAAHQHMVTYTVAFGLHGTLDPDNYNCPALRGLTNPAGATCPVWPQPNTDDKKIDDLWHTAINGRGEYLSAKNAQQLVYALTSILKDVSARAGTGASVAVNSKKLQEGTMIFQGSYNSAGWTGDLMAFSVSPTDGSISEEPVWKASQKLDVLADPALSRNIYTMGANGGVAFTAANLNSLTSEEQQDLETDAQGRQNMINYLRGDRSNDRNHGGTWRARVSLLGDIVHSAPIHVGNYLFVGANDGMLHCFDATGGSTGGDEVFAYIPSFVYPNLSTLANPDYDHRFFVDSTPFVGHGDGDTILLISGLGKGGRGYFCLDVTNPASFSAGNVKWEYPNSSSSSSEIANMGYSFSQPAIVPTEENGDVVIFGNGYDSPNARAVLFVIDKNNGSLINMIDTGVGDPTSNCNGLSTPVFVDPDNNGKANYAYAGDLLGNVWKFDLNGDVATWHVAYEDAGGTPMPLFQARDENGNPQPITTKLEVKQHCIAGYGGYIVIFGTGKFNAEGDFNTSGTQGVYGIWDWAGAWEMAADDLGVTVDTTDKFLGSFNSPGAGNLSNLYSMPDVGHDMTLVEQQAGSGELVNGELYRSSSANDIVWFNVHRYLELQSGGGTATYGQKDGEGYDVGWYFPLPNAGERVVADPILQMGFALIVSLAPSNSMCSPGGESYFYALNYCSGSAPDQPVFDIDGDGQINQNDTLSNGENPNSVELDDIYYTPVVLVPPNENDPLDFLVFGPKKTTKMKHQKLGIIFWRFLNLD